MKKINYLFSLVNVYMKSGFKKIQQSFQNKDTMKKLGIIIVVLLLLLAIVGLTGFLLLSIYRFIDNHMGELSIIAISLGAIAACLQSRKDKREENRRRIIAEKYKALMPKANSVYDKIAIFLTDILRDKSLSSLLNMAKPTNISNIIMEPSDQRIQIKTDGSGYLLMYRVDKLSIGALDDEHIFTIRDVLQGSINQRISTYGINGLCPPKQNTFLHIMGKPTDSHTYVTISLDYDEDKTTDLHTEAPVMFNLSADNDYGR